MGRRMVGSRRQLTYLGWVSDLVRATRPNCTPIEREQTPDFLFEYALLERDRVYECREVTRAIDSPLPLNLR